MVSVLPLKKSSTLWAEVGGADAQGAAPVKSAGLEGTRAGLRPMAGQGRWSARVLGLWGKGGADGAGGAAREDPDHPCREPAAAGRTFRDDGRWNCRSGRLCGGRARGGRR